jgi:hypothetical protein
MKIDNIELGTKEFNDLASAYFGGNPKRQTAKANIQSMANWWREPKKQKRQLRTLTEDKQSVSGIYEPFNYEIK